MRRAACAQRMMVSGALRATAWLFVTVAAHAQGLDARWRVPLHAAVHVFAAMGMHAYLARLYRQLP